MGIIRPYDGVTKKISYGETDWSKVRGKLIIGYNRKFWEHCLETDIELVSAFSRKDKHKKVHMRCDKKHVFLITPYMYFIDKRECPYCICNDDRGAVNIDETILSFWNDKRFAVEDISENSKEEYDFKCPFCGKSFQMSMCRMVNRAPKCSDCKDGQALTYSSELDKDMIYMFKSGR